MLYLEVIKYISLYIIERIKYISSKNFMKDLLESWLYFSDNIFEIKSQAWNHYLQHNTYSFRRENFFYLKWYENKMFVFYDIFSKDLFVLFGDFRVTREIFTYLETSPLPMKGLQILTYARYLWSLSSECSLACHTYFDRGHPFMSAISEDL